MFRVVLFWVLCLTLPLFGGRTYYVPDMSGDGLADVWLGLANPSAEVMAVSVFGYGADGLLLGQETMEIAANSRWEEATTNLFEGKASWARIEASASLLGYVRYERGQGLSVVPLTRFAGPEMYLPAVAAEGQGTYLKLVNTADQVGVAQSKPQRLPPFDFNSAHLHEPVTLSGFGEAYQPFSSYYEDVVTGVKEGLTWDRIKADVPMVGIQHFIESNRGFSSLAADLSPVREMVIAPLQPTRGGYQTKFVLTNTTEAPITVDLTNYDAIYPTPQEHLLTLEAGEKRTFTMGDPLQLTQYLPRWMRLRAHEQGLSGYLYSESRTGAVRTFVSGASEPGRELAFTYVRSDATYETRLTLINSSEESDLYIVSGYDANGQLVSTWNSSAFKTGESKEVTLTEIFGAKKTQVQWLKVRARIGTLNALGLLYARNGSSMAGLTSSVTFSGHETRPMADFEFSHAIDLAPQEWNGVRFDDTISRILFDETLLDPGCRIPEAGTFFLEHDLLAASSLTSLGYQPLIPACRDFGAGLREDVSLVSPFVEVPEFKEVYLTFNLRMINPGWATAGSRYGLVWHLEGDPNWQWFGMTGEMLLSPSSSLTDGAVEVCYRGSDHEVRLSSWCTLQALLPTSVAGKRIQFGLYYNHLHSHAVEAEGPILFVDNILIESAPRKHAYYFEDAAGAVLAEGIEAH